ncbi:MAG: S10 family peptidase [Vulcanimicrobiota bacterium]
MDKEIKNSENNSKTEEIKNRDELSGDRLAVTHHKMTVNGKTFRYTATAGYLNLDIREKDKEKDETHKAKVFFISYTLDGIKDTSKRPVTFAFNGGPGCASIWVNLGVMGPRRVVMTDVDQVLHPPYKMEDNQHTWLDFTDLVFIDPIGTGFSKTEKEKDLKKHWGVKEDLETVAEFIRLYLSKYKRWSSPKFVAGESYGTTRAAGLSDVLHFQHGIDLNGIILISSVLNFLTHRFKNGNDLPYALFLPTYTATAWYHKKLSSEYQKNLEKTLKEVEDWVINEYIVALAKGSTLSEEETQSVAQKLSDYTGLSKQYILNSNLRIKDSRFVKELLREEKRTVGRLDSRFKGIDSDAAGESAEYDPSFSWGPFVAAINQYVRQDLEYENDMGFVFLSNEANKSWKWDSLENDTTVNVAENLRQSISMNPYLQVLVASGYYDLATPYFATDYTINHLGLDPSLEKNVQIEYFPAGHMMYYHLPSLKKMKEDVKKLHKRCLR